MWISVWQGPTALAVGAGGVVWTVFSLVYHSLFFLLLSETARYRLKYCLKGPLSPKQPTNQPNGLTYGKKLQMQLVREDKLFGV